MPKGSRQLHMAEHAAYNRIEAARAAKRYPVLLEYLEAGAITLTAIRLLAPHLTQGNHRELLQRACHTGKREIALIVASLKPRADVSAVVRKVSAAAEAMPLTLDRYRVEFTLSRDNSSERKHRNGTPSNAACSVQTFASHSRCGKARGVASGCWPVRLQRHTRAMQRNGLSRVSSCGAIRCGR